MNIVLLLILSLIFLIESRTLWHQLHSYTFDDYINEYSKSYSSLSEREFRKQIFEKKLEKIKVHNADERYTWKEGVNHLTDRTDDEFKAMLGLKKSLVYQHQVLNKKRVVEVDVEDLPPSMDWRTKGVVTDVKDQGNCGSCWTFATAELTESYYALSTGQLHILSEQQILDCTPNPNQCGGTGGCGGGTAELAWARITAMGGLQSEWTYPYISYNGATQKCLFGTNSPVAKVSGFVNLPTNQQDPLLQHIATVGPLAISVDASTWGAYESGVYNGCNQTHPDLDHAVQLVGYGSDATLGDYWLVRNSWSPAWGEDGYIRLLRTSNFTCGVDLTPSDGDGCSGGPPTVEVCGTCGILYDGVYPVIAK
eukprot:TRINITY_DN4956_c0_g1_i1.p1 TRINITY_DN4956_c0_g1~~TRINITY_DN4956_c0_g1_i1.p1  ORF type:complete len:366 (-),score=82.89 TRINITY_DN4956_c0_g1_i1:61-1158(-)